MAQLEGIAIKPERKGPMVEYSRAEVSLEFGLIGDCRGTGGHDRIRQIVVQAQQSWGDALEALELPRDWELLPWWARRGNLLIGAPFVFKPEYIGWILEFGSKVALEITGECEPCKRMDERYPGLKEALKPEMRAGVTCRVIKGGIIHVGNRVILRSA